LVFAKLSWLLLPAAAASGLTKRVRFKRETIAVKNQSQPSKKILSIVIRTRYPMSIKKKRYKGKGFYITF
jgi:hypothetical protein